MAIISDIEEDQEPQKASTSSPSESSVGKYDDVLKPILDKQGPLGLMETVVDFVRRKSDLFKDEAVEKKVSAILSSLKEKDAEEKKKAEEKRLKDAEKAEKRLKEVEKKADSKEKESAQELKAESKKENGNVRVQVTRAEAKAAAAARQAQIKEAKAHDAQQQPRPKRKEKKGPSSETPKKRPRVEGPSAKAVQALAALGRDGPAQDPSPAAVSRGPRVATTRAEVGFVPQWSVKEDDTLAVGRVARELVMKGSLPRDATEAQKQGTATMITSACIFMAGAQNQMGQLAARAEAMCRDLEVAERERVSLDNERTLLLEKVEHLEKELVFEHRECDRKLSELKSQVKARIQEAEARGVEKYRSSEDFREEIKRAIAPGYTMGATEVRDWVRERYPGVSFDDSGLIFEDNDVEAAPSATEVADADGGGCSEEGKVQPHQEVPPTPGHGGSDQETLPAEDEAANPTDAP
ncbi:calponin homology domain-containing protein DDB_G0272472-like [Macadamia integrifolia]|uniref:calponin homology domain-containing protein DDB_G0272472-like n=1 Tax=Macadamia integrifolia TaxID=60698 RepID=UPI001C534102|nr:calponin homology domain-containing protein DDB_G0272472-like [Macadamia integrifolia]